MKSSKFNREEYRNDVLYRFFTDQIDKVEWEIQKNSDSLKKLSQKQEELKRGRKKMIELRRELKQRTTATIRH